MYAKSLNQSLAYVKSLFEHVQTHKKKQQKRTWLGVKPPIFLKHPKNQPHQKSRPLECTQPLTIDGVLIFFSFRATNHP